MAKARLPSLAKQYAPYDTLPEFAEGFRAYGVTWKCPYDGYKAQAWDRGLECAMKCQRLARKWDDEICND